MHGRATTGEDSDFLKKTLVRDMFVMTCGAMQSREMMSLSVKNTALWALKVPLEEMCRLLPVLGTKNRCFLRHSDNHQRHVSGRRLRAISEGLARDDTHKSMAP